MLDPKIIAMSWGGAEVSVLSGPVDYASRIRQLIALPERFSMRAAILFGSAVSLLLWLAIAAIVTALW